MPPLESLRTLARTIHHCETCARLRDHCRQIAREKRKSFQDETYWGRPVSGFGDPDARVFIVGLAPAAHGANRTGRIFTGDRSGDWLYRALHRAGFANQPQSTHREDGLQLKQTYVSCVVRCAPPDNKPSPEEIKTCVGYLHRELEILHRARIFIALGQIAYQGVWKLLSPRDRKITRPAFAHGKTIELPDQRWILPSYHPSQQNTFTGRLTEPMFDSVFSRAKDLLGRMR